jgi:hypothetical protein
MKNWFTSLNGAITLSTIAILIFLGRTFIDFYYVYHEFSLDTGMISLIVVLNLALFGGWFWGFLAAVKGSFRGLITVFGFNLFFLLFIAIGTLVSYCPSPCQTGWPLGEIFIWLSLIVGLLASTAAGLQIVKGRQQYPVETATG